jgi:hypothetical protein
MLLINNFDVSSEQVVHGRPAAAIRDMNEVDAGALGEQHHGEMADAAGPDRRIVDLARARLRGRHHVGQRAIGFLRLGA